MRLVRTLAVLVGAVLTAATLVIGAGVAVAAPPPPVPQPPGAQPPGSQPPVSQPPVSQPPGAQPAPPAAAPCAPTARACFSVGRRTAWLTDGTGHVVLGPVPALGGSAAHPTPTGTFRVAFKDADHVSNLFTPGQMPNSVFFSPAIAFHQGSLSQRSHGCVHLSKSVSRAFFAALRPGDQVQVVR